jgi:hypothetical protein
MLQNSASMLSLRSTVIYVEKTSEGWVDVREEVANSRRLHFPVYGLLNTCPLDHVCVLDI